MPLNQLADEIIRLSQQCASTPVIVTPTYLSLRREFFLELVSTLQTKSDRSIRIDWYRPMPGYFSVLGDRIAAARASSTNRALASRTGGTPARRFRLSLWGSASRHRSRNGTAAGGRARIQITASIGRPGGACRELVVGLCDQRLELPPWTTAIRLGGTPGESLALQSATD